MENITICSVIGVIGGVLGFLAKSLWDLYVGHREKIRLEVWKIRTAELEQRLSKFYWPLYVRLQRDDLAWKRVFYDLRLSGDHRRPEWVEGISEVDRSKFSNELEDKVLIPNHIEAIAILRSEMHRANADSELADLLARYMRHVDVYVSLRSASLRNVDPMHVGEPYPSGLSAAVEVRLRKYQAEYESLLRDRGILDLSHPAS
jgi:hypothetical protein